MFYRHLYEDKNIVTGDRCNLPGQGNKLTIERQELFELVTILFEYYRYICKIAISRWYIADFVLQAANQLGMNYNPGRAMADAEYWIRKNFVKYYRINSTCKFKPIYVAAKVGLNQENVMNIMQKYNIEIEGVIDLDEIMVFHDFCVSKITLSYPGQNTEVYEVPNNKDSTTFVNIWEWNKFRSPLC